MAGNPIHLNPNHKGLLHRELGIPQGQKIPIARIHAAEHSSDPAERKRAYFADSAKTKFHHNGRIRVRNGRIAD